LGLFCAGQSSTLTCTMAGQVVMEGFLEMKMVAWLRRLITRLVAIVPAVCVIAAMGSAGTYQLLILSQVILSVALPFVLLPLIRFSSTRLLMHEFTNPVWLQVLSWLFSLFVLALNVWQIGIWIAELYTLPTASAVVGSIFVLPLAAALVALMVWMTFIWKSKGIHNYELEEIAHSRNPSPSPPTPPSEKCEMDEISTE